RAGDAAPMAYVQLVGRDLSGENGAPAAEKEAGKEEEKKEEKAAKKAAKKKGSGKSEEKS
ncbi:MAG: bL17 family ribosomal protein, partial [Gammaproteobacteria bacterium]|nr:bL17 family ribosomal protein [Gammaproteobacteria bacterium]